MRVLPSPRSSRRDHVLAGAPALRSVDDQELLVVEVAPRDGDDAPLDLVGRAAGEHVVERLGWQLAARLDPGVEVAALVESAELPEAEVDHRHDAGDDEQVEPDPLRAQQEPVHATATVAVAHAARGRW